MNVPTCANPTRRYAARAGALKSLTYSDTTGAKLRCASRTTEAMPARGQARAAALRIDPDALHLARVRGDRADLRLEDDAAVLDPGEGPPGPDELRHPGPVGGAAVAGRRRDPHLLGEHGDARGHQHVQLIRPYPADQRVRRARGRPGHGQHRLHGADVPRRSPVRLQQPPQSGDVGLRADQRRAAAPLVPGPLRERGNGVRGRGDRNQVGAGVAQRSQPAAGIVTPDLRAQPGGIKAHGMDPGADEDVRNRLLVADTEHLVAVAIIEDAQRPGPCRFHAEHHSSVAGPGRAMVSDAPTR